MEWIQPAADGRACLSRSEKKKTTVKSETEQRHHRAEHVWLIDKWSLRYWRGENRVACLQRHYWNKNTTTKIRIIIFKTQSKPSKESMLPWQAAPPLPNRSPTREQQEKEHKCDSWDRNRLEPKQKKKKLIIIISENFCCVNRRRTEENWRHRARSTGKTIGFIHRKMF